MKENLIKKYIPYAITVLSLCFLIVVRNSMVDTDTWHLVTSGKYIVENDSVPKVNPWTIHSNFACIVQQWLCDIENYIMYKNFGKVGIWILCIVHGMCALSSLYICAKSFIKSEKDLFVLVVFMLLPIVPFVTNRPQVITFSVCMLATKIMHYFICNIKDCKVGKEELCLSLKFYLMSLFLANYHISLWVSLFILTGPYLFDILNSSVGSLKVCFKERLRYAVSILTLVYVPSFLLGLINPNGLNGVLYIYKSVGITGQGKYSIEELNPVKYASFYGVIVLLFLILFLICISRYYSEVRISTIILSIGTFVLAIVAVRNVWFLMFPLVPITKILISHIKSKRVSPILLCLIVTIGTFSLSSNTNISSCSDDTIYSPIKAVNYLNSKDIGRDNCNIYAGLNTGAYFEYYGYKTYIDARPELYLRSINGASDIYYEELALICNYSYKEETGKGVIDTTNVFDYNEFVNKYNFRYIYLTEDMNTFRDYIKNDSRYKLVCTKSDNSTVKKDFNYFLYEKVVD